MFHDSSSYYRANSSSNLPSQTSSFSLGFNLFNEGINQTFIPSTFSPNFQLPTKASTLKHKKKFPIDKIKSASQEKRSNPVNYKDLSSDSDSIPPTNKKKRQLERNRMSARESRRKKKEYIQMLEQQVICF